MRAIARPPLNAGSKRGWTSVDWPGFHQLVKSRTTLEGLLLRWARPKAVLVDFEATDFRFERRAREAEPRRRTRRTEHPSAARAQGVFDNRLRMAGDRTGQA